MAEVAARREPHTSLRTPDRRAPSPAIRFVELSREGPEMTSPELDRRGSAPRDHVAWPHRRVLAIVAALTSLAGIAGAIQLLAGVATPPDGDLPLGLSTWVLPGLWLLASVGIPSGVAA